MGLCCWIGMFASHNTFVLQSKLHYTAWWLLSTIINWGFVLYWNRLRTPVDVSLLSLFSQCSCNCPWSWNSGLCWSVPWHCICGIYQLKSIQWYILFYRLLAIGVDTKDHIRQQGAKGVLIQVQIVKGRERSPVCTCQVLGFESSVQTVRLGSTPPPHSHSWMFACRFHL